jgi:peptidoglycan/LPS O-acetylase OafA/YrhL
MMPRRDGWIDCLRALSALAVVFYHFNVLPIQFPAEPSAIAWHQLCTYGYLGVSVFFVLSGYCLAPGWARSTHFGEFMTRRTWRILPPYWCSLLLVVALAVAFKLVTGVNDIAALPRTPVEIASTILLLTNPLSSIPTVNWVYWSLTFLLVAYLLLGMTLLAPRSVRVHTLAGLHVLLCVVDVIFHPAPVGPLFFIRYWPVFGMGLALALIPQNKGIGAIMAAVSVLHALWTFANWPNEIPFLAMSVWTVAFLAITRNRPFPNWLQPLARVSKISYSLYLIHVPVAINTLLRLFPTEFASTLPFVATQFALLSLTLLAAWLFYLACERPFLPRPRY